MKNAMRSGNKAELSALRNIIGKIKAKQIDNGKILTDDECIKILLSSAKQLKDSIEQYKNGNRIDLADNETFELSIVQKYLPKQLEHEEIKKIVEEIIRRTNAKTIKDLGPVIGIALKETNGKADGKTIQKIVAEILSK